MEKSAELLTKRIIIGCCIFAFVLMITVTQMWYNPLQFTWINSKVGTIVMEQSQLTTTSKPMPDPNLPVLVTAFSSNHFMEAQALFYTIHKYLSGYRVVAYDLGLNEYERARTKKHCKCELRSLNYDQYPEHVRVPTSFAFKPVIVNETVSEFGFVFWIDTSVRFTSDNVGPLWNLMRSVGFACAQESYVVSCMTHPATFAALNVSQPALYERARTIQATYLLFTGRPEIVENIIVPWVQCAMNKECIAPDGATAVGCQFENAPSYCKCHRFDQSALEVILYRYFLNQFTLDPTTRKGPLAPFSIGTWQNISPEYDILKVTRGDAKDYFPPQ